MSAIGSNRIAVDGVDPDQRWPPHRRRREIAECVVVGHLALSAADTEATRFLRPEVAVGLSLPRSAQLT